MLTINVEPCHVADGPDGVGGGAGERPSVPGLHPGDVDVADDVIMDRDVMADYIPVQASDTHCIIYFAVKFDASFKN